MDCRETFFFRFYISLYPAIHLMIRRQLKYLLYPLGIYTTYVGVTHMITTREINSRSKKNLEGDEQFGVLKVLGRYENPFLEYRPQTIYEFLLMRVIEIWEGEHGALHEDIETRKDLIGWERVDLKIFKEINMYKDVLTYTWIGQSCGIVTLPNSGPKILLDPLFEPNLLTKFGPKRILPIPITLNEILDNRLVDYILVSHDHPDHLEKEAIEVIGNQCNWIVPMGVGKYLNSSGVDKEKIIEMIWWDRIELESKNSSDKYEIVCLPAMHWSGRLIYDSNMTLWSSFLVLRNNRSIFYHAGDTGYTTPLFEKIHQQYGPTLFAALPIGQYCPEWHQSPRHIGPKEAIKICDEMNISKMVGVHWGTFVLSSEKYWEPGYLLNKLKRDYTGKCEIIVPKLGSTIVVEDIEVNDND